MTAQECYEAGNLSDAVTAALDEVRQAPTDVGRRWFLCELLALAGDLERADRQLDTLSTQEPAAGPAVALFRQLLRAEQARREVFAAGRVPEFLVAPSPALRDHLEASIHLREGRLAEAAALLEQAEGQRPPAAGTCDGQAFDDFRDMDDLTAPLLEVLTGNGKYYWVPIEAVASVEFGSPAHARDLLWRPARLAVRGGPEGDVFLPALYAGSHAEADERLRLGRATDWRGGDGGPVRGVGQRIFMVGEEARPALELRSLAFAAPSPL